MPVCPRIIEAEEITKAVAGLCIDANIRIGEDILSSLSKARESETSELAAHALDALIENAKTARRENLPACQDTGMAVVFVSIGEGVYVKGDINAAVNEGVRLGYRDGYFRNSVVADPISRVNTGDNTPAVIYCDFIKGDKLRLTVAPKGFGSENMSALKMLTPSDGIEGVEDFVANTVARAGANPCPPVIVGVGVGGTMEKAALLSKQALLHDVDGENPVPFWADVEKRLLARINALGIGASGYGGGATAIGVHILTYPTHIAGLPVAVNIGCHATRHKSVEL
jgi:fumarate hydratase subunit alpha